MLGVGGPSWTVRLGRRDSTTASRDQANLDLPSTFASLDVASKGLSARLGCPFCLVNVYFHVAMPPGAVKPFYASLVEKLQKAYSVDAVKAGVFGAMMKVSFVNDGPLTMQLDSGQSSKTINDVIEGSQPTSLLPRTQHHNRKLA
ncbi:hypothetical protein OROMI_028252 [Orobanche minor]